MELTIRQKSNIRFFVYYLVNGTLNFDLLHNQLPVIYHNYLADNPKIFYRACCVFINQECQNNPDWPNVSRLGKFVYQEIIKNDSVDNLLFEDWEIEQSNLVTNDLANTFKNFAYWFSIGQSTDPFLETAHYKSFIKNGASFAEQCFAIWANVIKLEDNQVVNSEHALQRVKEYIKSYYIPEYECDLEDWEYELWMY